MKQERTTVSFPPDLMAAAQGFCREEHLKFSNYLEKLVRENLIAAGKLPADETVDALSKTREAIKIHGAPAVVAKIEELALQDATAVGGGK